MTPLRAGSEYGFRVWYWHSQGLWTRGKWSNQMTWYVEITPAQEG